MIPRLIGVTGRKYNGKDTIANYYTQKHNFVQLSFAGPLKDICELLFDFNYEQLHGSLKEVPDDNWFNLTPRQVLQFVGTEMFRNMMGDLTPELEGNFWILCLKNKIKKLQKNKPDIHIVISDVRFPNELDLIKELGGVSLRVVRPSHNIKNNDTHESEILIDKLDVDIEIINDGNIAELHHKLDLLF